MREINPADYVSRFRFEKLIERRKVLEARITRLANQIDSLRRERDEAREFRATTEDELSDRLNVLTAEREALVAIKAFARHRPLCLTHGRINPMTGEIAEPRCSCGLRDALAALDAVRTQHD